MYPYCLFGFNIAFKHEVHIEKVPACSSGTLTNVLPHWNAMLQTQDMTPHPVTINIYRHGADLLCYHCCGMLHWNAQQPILLSWKSFPDLPHTPANAQLYDADMVVVSRKPGIKYSTHQVLNPGPVVCKSITLSFWLLLSCSCKTYAILHEDR